MMLKTRQAAGKLLRTCELEAAFYGDILLHRRWFDLLVAAAFIFGLHL
jgi:hypothetical protein